jgi:hypothetical protein
MELIIKFISKMPQIERLFHYYSSLFNEYYRARSNQAYFETILRGFLYVLPDLETFQRIADSVPPLEIIQTLLQENRNLKKDLEDEFINRFNFSPNNLILLEVEVFNFSAEVVYPLICKIYTSINTDIQCSPLEGQVFFISFQTLDAFIDYFTIFLLSIRPDN